MLASPEGFGGRRVPVEVWKAAKALCDSPARPGSAKSFCHDVHA